MASKKEVDFDAVGKKESDWREWRDRNEDRLKSTEHVAALQYQLRYLALTIQATSGDDPDVTMKKVMPGLLEYLDDQAGVYEKLEGESSVLKRSVLQSTFAERLKLNITIDRDRAWSFTPAALATIYEGTVFPFYRDSKNSAGLQSAWDKRIAQEALMLEWSEGRRGGGGGMGSDIEGRIRDFLGGGRGFRRSDDRDRQREAAREEARVREELEEQFKEVRLPTLQWGKIRDGYLFGAAKALALGKMSSHVRANLSHPLAKDWLDELKGFAEGGVDADTYYDEDEDAEGGRRGRSL